MPQTTGGRNGILYCLVLELAHGGNIDGFTRTMTTAIALETSKGDLPLAMGLGIVLISLVTVVNGIAWGVRRYGELRAG